MIKEVDNLDRDIIKNFSVDFIAKELSRRHLVEKYNLSETMVNIIVRKFNLVNKRNEYREKVITKALHRCSNYQSKIVADVYRLFAEHISNVDRLKRITKSKTLTHEQVKELAVIFTLITKERRLDNDQPTDNTNVAVQVILPDNMPIISNNNLKDVVVTDPNDTQLKDIVVVDSNEQLKDDNSELIGEDEVQLDESILPSIL